MVVKLRVERPARPMPIPDPEHAVGIHDRSAGMTRAGVCDPRRHRCDCLLDGLGVGMLDGMDHARIAECVSTLTDFGAENVRSNAVTDRSVTVVLPKRYLSGCHQAQPWPRATTRRQWRSPDRRRQLRQDQHDQSNGPALHHRGRSSPRDPLRSRSGSSRRSPGRPCLPTTRHGPDPITLVQMSEPPFQTAGTTSTRHGDSDLEEPGGWSGR